MVIEMFRSLIFNRQLGNAIVAIKLLEMSNLGMKINAIFPEKGLKTASHMLPTESFK